MHSRTHDFTQLTHARINGTCILTCELLLMRFAQQMKVARGVDSELVAEVMCNLASNCALRGKTQEAFDYYAQASMIAQSLRSTKKIGRMLEDLKWLENATL